MANTDRSRKTFEWALRTSQTPAVGSEDIQQITIGAALSQAAKDAGDRIALKECTLAGTIGRAWTFRELQSDSVRLAHVLLGRHAPGARIAVWAHNVPEWVLIEFAAAYAGLTLVTVNPSFRPREVKFVLEQSGAEALYYVESFRGNPIAEIAKQVSAELPRLRHLIELTDMAALYAGEQTGRSLPVVQPRDPVQVQYTSGTTGFPKGAVLHHQGLYENARLNAERAGIARDSVWLNFMPMFHTGGCALTTLGALSARATMILAAQFDPEALARIIESERVTCFLGVPTMLTALMECQARQPRDWTSIRSVMSGGSMVAPELVKRAQEVFGASFQIVYGQTETSPVISLVWRDSAVDDISQTVGQPLPAVEVSIRDPRNNEVVPVGQIGEICSRGPMNMLEYNADPQATARTIDAEGWLHTGDLGCVDARGYLKVTGRVKELIIRGGENLFPVEIENAMLEHADLSEVAVIGLPDEKLGEIVACFMRLRGDNRPPRDELVRFCRERLSPQKTPAIWVYVDKFPLTASGKVQKFVLRDQYVAGAFKLLTL